MTDSADSDTTSSVRRGDTPNSPAPPGTATGRWTVVAMFTFAIVMVFSLWGYWEFYTRAFRPLQYAIAREFPGSSPRVIGGKHKSHKPDAVMTLRVVARVPLEEFDLSMDIPRAEDRARRLAELVLQMEDLSDYEVLQIRLYQRVPEQATRYWEEEHSPSDWAKLAKTGSRLSDEEQPLRDQPSL